MLTAAVSTFLEAEHYLKSPRLSFRRSRLIHSSLPKLYWRKTFTTREEIKAYN